MISLFLTFLLIQKQKVMKYYAFMPFWHWPEVMDERPTDGDYILGNIVRTADSLTALTLYSETPCPASQLIEANSEEELEAKIEEWRAKDIRQALKLLAR
nr:MAG: hypothetical protein [Bacteriophage sp.]